MTNNKLDDRHVEYNLEDAIGVLKPERGGTGQGNFQFANRVVVTEPTGDATSPIRLNVSNTTTTDLGALTSYNPAKGPFENRIAAAESHIADNSLHLPSSPGTNYYLRGDRTWQNLTSITNSGLGYNQNYTTYNGSFPFHNTTGKPIVVIFYITQDNNNLGGAYFEIFASTSSSGVYNYSNKIGQFRQGSYTFILPQNYYYAYQIVNSSGGFLFTIKHLQ